MPAEAAQDSLASDIATATELLAKPADKLTADEIALARTIATTIHEIADDLQENLNPTAIANSAEIITLLTTAAQLFTAALIGIQNQTNTISAAPTLVLITTPTQTTFNEDQIASMRGLALKLRGIATAQISSKKSAATTTMALIHTANGLKKAVDQVATPANSQGSIYTERVIAAKGRMSFTSQQNINRLATFSPTSPIECDGLQLLEAVSGFSTTTYNKLSTYTTSGLLLSIAPPTNWQFDPNQNSLTYTDRRPYIAQATQGTEIRSADLFKFLLSHTQQKPNETNILHVFFAHENHGPDLRTNTKLAPWVLIPNNTDPTKPARINLLPADKLLAEIQAKLANIIAFAKNGKSMIGGSRPPFNKTHAL